MACVVCVRQRAEPFARGKKQQRAINVLRMRVRMFVKYAGKCFADTPHGAADMSDCEGIRCLPWFVLKRSACRFKTKALHVFERNATCPPYMRQAFFKARKFLHPAACNKNDPKHPVMLGVKQCVGTPCDLVAFASGNGGTYPAVGAARVTVRQMRQGHGKFDYVCVQASLFYRVYRKICPDTPVPFHARKECLA